MKGIRRDQQTFAFEEPRVPIARPPAQQHSETSVAAAEQQTAGKAGGDRAAILALLEADGPLTDEAIGGRLGIPANTVRPRRVELVRAGLVVAIDNDGVTVTGSRATRWGRA